VGARQQSEGGVGSGVVGAREHPAELQRGGHASARGGRGDGQGAQDGGEPQRPAQPDVGGDDGGAARATRGHPRTDTGERSGDGDQSALCHQDQHQKCHPDPPVRPINVPNNLRTVYGDIFIRYNKLTKITNCNSGNKDKHLGRNRVEIIKSINFIDYSINN
jgi:hypothetical protein